MTIKLKVKPNRSIHSENTVELQIECYFDFSECCNSLDPKGDRIIRLSFRLSVLIVIGLVTRIAKGYVYHFFI
ncbi:12350_t:CDS:2 [Acaulospora morrowiae]|uniref:12350_t:CDS:1 n=1 Tax=Acaulospora morrowiae TaxID=94023 RepID=A0A9N9AGX6_9GLOM|nr:12350_t:CDS:2 [Acaulospora morrowiae]